MLVAFLGGYNVILMPDSGDVSHFSPQKRYWSKLTMTYFKSADWSAVLARMGHGREG